MEAGFKSAPKLLLQNQKGTLERRTVEPAPSLLWQSWLKAQEERGVDGALDLCQNIEAKRFKSPQGTIGVAPFT